MPSTIIPFGTTSYRHDSLPISAQRVVNMYAEAQPQSAKTPVSLHGVPGITTYAICGTGPIRGAHVMGGVLYVLSGGFLYSVTNAPIPVATQLGGQVSGTGIVSMDDNGEELMITNGANGYLYDTTSGFRLITDTDFVAGNTCTTLDSYFVADRANTGEIAISDLLDGDAWSSTAFATAEAKSDNVLAVRSHKQLLYIFGQGTIEPWQNVGSANFPFQRIPGSAIDRGVIGSQAIADGDDMLFLIGDDRVSYKLSGAQLQRISTHALEKTWQRFATVSDAFGLNFNFDGHKFLPFTFPTESRTFVYDIASQLWHERESRDLNGTPLGRWRGNVAISAYGKTFIGDAYTGKLGYLDPTVFTEFDDPIYAEVVSPPLHADGKRMFMSLFELEVESGVGLTTGQGSDPQVMLSISDDGGRTWSDQQPWQSMGTLGAYRQRLEWRRLGSFYQRHLKVTMSDPVKRTIIRARAELSVGM